MMAERVLPLVATGDHVHMRKPHPCGSSEWLVTRIGADIGLRCVGCGRHVLLSRGSFNRQVKRIVSLNDPSAERGD
jgi:hypothetical protein